MIMDNWDLEIFVVTILFMYDKFIDPIKMISIKIIITVISNENIKIEKNNRFENHLFMKYAITLICKHIRH